jgi:multidrug resistance efflux pump
MAGKHIFQIGILGLVLLAASCQRNSAPPLVSGTIETDEAHVASRYGGRVEKILAQEGDPLQPGQVIVELDAAELGARRNQAAATLAEMEAGPRPQEIQAAKNDWQSQQSDLELARDDAKRAIELFAQKTISDTERDHSVIHAQTLEKSVAAAKDRYDLLLAGTRPEEIDVARAHLAEIDTQLREMKISAPTNCVLEVLSVKVGDVLASNQEVATLILPQHLWVRVYAPEIWLGHIQIGETVKVRVDSYGDRDFVGTVEQINRAAEFTPRNVQTYEERIKQVFGIKVRLNDDQNQFHAGMSADVYFPNVEPVKE